MLKAWTLHHFKSVYDKTELSLAPLTVFVGANSSGKSTVIQSILLTAQTLQNPVPSRSVVLNGHILKLGTFTDVISNAPEVGTISVGFELSPPVDLRALPHSGLSLRHQSEPPPAAIACTFRFAPGDPKSGVEIAQLQPRLEDFELIVTGPSVAVSPEEGDTEQTDSESLLVRRTSISPAMRLQAFSVSPEAARAVDLATLEYEVLAPSHAHRFRRYGRTRPAKTVGALLFHFLPVRLAVAYDAVQEEVDHLVEALTRPEGSGYRDLDPYDTSSLAMNDAVRDLLLETLSSLADSPDAYRAARYDHALAALRADFSFQGLRRFFSNVGPSVRRELARRLAEKQAELRTAARGGRSAQETLAYAPLSDLAEAGSEYVRFFFSRLVRYLGPLRDEPKPVYPLFGATDPREVGYRGEHTAAVLDLNRNTIVEYVPPDAFETPQGRPKPRVAGLSEAVLSWLTYLGVAKDVSTADLGKFGHELKVAVGTDSHMHDLTHVGVGVSQVLPILVLSLLADAGSTLVFEQPELHLHPRVQTRLADFFVSLTMLGKQTIIETHSEYLVNRLRYRAVVADSTAVSEQVLLYFVEKKGQRSSYRPIRISESGTLSEWPQGFFDDSHETAAAILQASMAKRKKKAAR